MEEIQEIELVLGLPYGKAPAEYTNSLLGRLRHGSANRKLSLGSILGSIGSSNAIAYAYQTHSIFLPSSTPSPFERFARYHELGHGYNNQINPIFGDLDLRWAELAAAASLKGFAPDSALRKTRIPWLWQELSRESLERILVARSVDEGVADYIAIQCEKRKKNMQVYCYARESMLATFENTDEILTAGTPLSSETARQIPDWGTEAVQEFLDSMELKGLARAKAIVEATCMMEDCAYPIGHYYVRSICEKLGGPIGPTINAILCNIPNSLDELSRQVNKNLKQSTAQP